MKTMQAIIVSGLFGVSLALPASATTLADFNSELLKKPLAELQENLAIQTKQAIEKTTKELFEHFQMTVRTQKHDGLTMQAAIELDKNLAAEKPQAEE